MTGLFILVRPQLFQPVVINSKIMREFVMQRFANTLAHSTIVFARGKNRVPINTDLVRRNQAVRADTFRQRDAVIKTEQILRIIQPGELERLRIGNWLDDNRDIRDARRNFRRQFI